MVHRVEPVKKTSAPARWEEGRSEEGERGRKAMGGMEEQTYTPHPAHPGACASRLPFPLGGERLVRWAAHGTGRSEAILCA
jgi:hypothetical protein